MIGVFCMRVVSWIIILNALVHGTIFSSKEEADITAFVQNVMDCRDIPGLTLSVVKGDEIWTKGFGLADIKSGRKVTNETLFAIGSLGKAFTMTLLGSLIQSAGYTWDTKLIDITGLNLKFIDDKITKEATLSDLLAHKTGLSTVADYGFIGGYPSAATRAFLSKRIQFLPTVKEFRKSYVYNNMMYTLLGHVTDILGKDSWEDLVTSRVFEPIGMLSTKVLLTGNDVQQDNAAKPYIMPGDQLEDGHYDIYRIGPLVPAGGILSNADDMAKWMQFNMKNGQTEGGQQLLDAPLLQEAFKEQNVFPAGGGGSDQTTPTYPVNDVTTGYGYAWLMSEYRGFRRIWHSGGLFSYIALIWLFPDQQIGVFGNINGPGKVGTPGMGLKAVLSYVSDLLLEQTPWLNHETACSFPSPWVNYTNIVLNDTSQDNLTNDKLADFVGTYGNRLLPDIKISLKERERGRSYLWIEMNRIKGELLLTADEDKFKFKMVDPWEYAVERELWGLFITYPVEFTRSKNGKVTSFELTLGDKEIMKYEKSVRFLDALPISVATCQQISVVLMFCVFMCTKLVTG